VRVIGTGSALPPRIVTNDDLSKVMDTSDEWIVQRTGIRERHYISAENGETTTSLATEAARKAIEAAGIEPTEVDFIICATMSADMPTPGVSTLVADQLGCGHIGAMDMNAACSGFVFALNMANAFIQSGAARTLVLIGADCLTRHVDLSTFGRGTAILFGDAASAIVLRADDHDTTTGLLAHSMHSDGSGSKHLYVPQRPGDFPEGTEPDERKVNVVQMNGQAVFRFAVSRFPELIGATLDAAGLNALDVHHYVCHQANQRILDAGRERFGIPADRMVINIDRVGNTVAASCPLILDELTRSGRVTEGQRVMFLAFGAGLTWASSLWQL
jgi:3-oxoacyl-[acyl-carrier-protein] synthase-3